MSKEITETSKIRDYLLGSSSVIDEQFEERLMTNDLLFQELQIQEEELIQDYVDGNLSDSEEMKFESHFLVSEERQEKLNFAQSLRIHIGNVESSREGQVENSKSENSYKKTRFSEVISNLFKSPVPVAICLLVIAGLTFALVWTNFSTQNENEIALASLNRAFKKERPLESRISGFDYAPIRNTRGDGDSKVDSLELENAELLINKNAREKLTADNLHSLGKLYLSKKEIDKAIDQFEIAIKMSPDKATLHNDLAAAYWKKGNMETQGKLNFFAKAYEQISKSIKLNNTLPEAYFNKALILESKTLKDQAIEAWKEYIKLDKNSKWSDEARNHIENLEKKTDSNTKEKVLNDFIEAKELDDSHKAWQILSRNREMITGRLIPQQLTYLFVDSKIRKNDHQAKQAINSLKYIGKLEQNNSGDLFWQDLAKYYSEVSVDKIHLLKISHDYLKLGYKQWNDRLLEKSKESFVLASKNFLKAGNTFESKICDYWIANNLFQLNELNLSNEKYFDLADYSQIRNYKWLATQAFIRLAYAIGVNNKISEAIKFSKKALVLAEKTNDVYDLQRIYSLLSEDYGRLKRFDESINFSEKSLEIHQLPEVSQRQKWSDYDSITRNFIYKGLFNSAAAFQEEALTISKVIKEKYFEQGSCVYLGKIYAFSGDYGKAEEFIKRSIELANSFEDIQIRLKMTSHSKLQYAHLKRMQKKYDEAIDLYSEANQFYSTSEFQYENYDGQKGVLISYYKLNDDNAIQDQLPIVLNIFRNYRSEILEDQNRISFFDKEQSVYDIAIEHELEKGNYSKAFNFAEESRSRSLLDLQQTNFQVSDNKKQIEITFSNRVTDPKTILEVQSEMPENTQLLVYSILLKKLSIWVITKDSIFTGKTDVSSADISEMISSYRKSISNKQGLTELKIKSRELYEILIQPIRKQLDINKELFIIPDKSLNKFPFDSLYSGKYLIEEFKISYSPSVSVFLYCSKKGEGMSLDKSENLLSIGNPSFNLDVYDQKLRPLPFAKVEAEDITKNYKNYKLYVGSSATRTKIKKELKSADVVHFAGHYVVDENSPLLSSLILAGNTKEESSLTNYEIISEKFTKTRLIILSACDTGVERFYNGEGMIGGSRTFLATGVPLVVASQWAVDSESSKDLMVQFHKLRKLGNHSTSEALRQSQINMMKEEKYSHPYYWVAFMTLGGYAKF